MPRFDWANETEPHTWAWLSAWYLSLHFFNGILCVIMVWYTHVAASYFHNSLMFACSMVFVRKPSPVLYVQWPKKYRLQSYPVMTLIQRNHPIYLHPRWFMLKFDPWKFSVKKLSNFGLFCSCWQACCLFNSDKLIFATPSHSEASSGAIQVIKVCFFLWIQHTIRRCQWWIVCQSWKFNDVRPCALLYRLQWGYGSEG